jgi:hypothetical protein
VKKQAPAFLFAASINFAHEVIDYIGAVFDRSESVWD